MLDFRLVKISLGLFKIGVSWTTFIRKWDLKVRTFFAGVKPGHAASTILHKCHISLLIFTRMLHAYKVVLKTQLAEFIYIYFFSLGIKCKKQPLKCSPSCDSEIFEGFCSLETSQMVQNAILVSATYFFLLLFFCIFLGDIVEQNNKCFFAEHLFFIGICLNEQFLS